MADSFFRWPVALEHSRKTPFQKVRQIILILLPVVFFIIAVILLFQKIQKPPLALIEEAMKSGDFASALSLTENELSQGQDNRIRYLMLATVASAGIENNQGSDYETLLQNEDTSGIYLKESFLRRLDLIEKIPKLPELVIRYHRFFPGSKNLMELNQPIERHILSETIWQPLPQDEVADFFSLIGLLEPERIMKVSGDNLQLRNAPSTNSDVLAKLPRGTKVLKRVLGPEEVIGGQRAFWVYVFTSDQLSGWVFSKYLK